jgi:hypothetical protein
LTLRSSLPSAGQIHPLPPLAAGRVAAGGAGFNGGGLDEPAGFGAGWLATCGGGDVAGEPAVVLAGRVVVVLRLDGDRMPAVLTPAVAAPGGRRSRTTWSG